MNSTSKILGAAEHISEVIDLTPARVIYRSLHTYIIEHPSLSGSASPSEGMKQKLSSNLG